MKITLRSYLVGFAISLGLTLFAFGVVYWHESGAAFSNEMMMSILVLLATAQLYVQLRYFLHVGKNSNAWNVSALVLALLIIVFVVVGSLWIMSNLEHNTHLPFDGAPSVLNEH